MDAAGEADTSAGGKGQATVTATSERRGGASRAGVIVVVLVVCVPWAAVRTPVAAPCPLVVAAVVIAAVAAATVGITVIAVTLGVVLITGRPTVRARWVCTGMVCMSTVVRLVDPAVVTVVRVPAAAGVRVAVRRDGWRRIIGKPFAEWPECVARARCVACCLMHMAVIPELVCRALTHILIVHARVRAAVLAVEAVVGERVGMVRIGHGAGADRHRRTLPRRASWMRDSTPHGHGKWCERRRSGGTVRRSRAEGGRRSGGTLCTRR